MPPVKHALLSASSASRWLVCTAAPRFEEGLPESTSEYAEEGRLAHAIGELKVTKKCTPMSTRTYNTRLNKLKKDPLYTPEMDKTTDLYLEHITEQVMAYDTAPTVAVEVQVDFSDYVPEGFGTCDCCIIGGDLLSIVDYKHGKGVPVSAVGNPQMRLYALGALHRYAPVFGDTIKRVRMTIDQPRLDSYTTDEITVEELRAWGESIKPIAQKAFSGLGEFVPGDHCRFCRGKAQCRARANINTALEDFKDCVPAGSNGGGLVPGAERRTSPRSSRMLKSVTCWSGASCWSNGTRTWRTTPRRPCWQARKSPAGNWWRAGAIGPLPTRTPPSRRSLPPVMMRPWCMTASPRPSPSWRKLMGKADFKEKIGSFVYKPPGKPTLAPASDKREAYSPAATDFAGVGADA